MCVPAVLTKSERLERKGIMGEWNPDKYSVEDSLFGFISFTDGRVMQLETAFALNIKRKG